MSNLHCLQSFSGLRRTQDQNKKQGNKQAQHFELTLLSVLLSFSVGTGEFLNDGEDVSFIFLTWKNYETIKILIYAVTYEILIWAVIILVICCPFPITTPVLTLLIPAFMRRRALGSRLCPCQPRAVLIQKKSTTGSKNEQILKLQFSIYDSIVTKNFESEEKQ